MLETGLKQVECADDVRFDEIHRPSYGMVYMSLRSQVHDRIGFVCPEHRVQFIEVSDVRLDEFMLLREWRKRTEGRVLRVKLQNIEVYDP